VSLNLKGGGSLNPSSHETVDKKMHYIYQDGPAVYKFAVRKMAEATEKVLERNGVKGSDLGCFIPHQANKRIITATADRLGMNPRTSSSILRSTGTRRAERFHSPWRQLSRRAS